MILDILKHPDEQLRQLSTKVELPEQAEEVTALVENMVETMRASNGMGLAAPQVGTLLRVFVLDMGDGAIRTFINPIITSAKGETITEEGCLSFPEQRRKTARPRKIKVMHQGIDGQWHLEKATELYAVAIQHELDHLDGKLFIDLPGVK